MQKQFEAIRQRIARDESNAAFTKLGYQPLFTAGEKARIVVVGHAPGRKTQELGIPWQDASGLKLMDWLGVTEEQFRDTRQFAQLPMDFYYQGKGKSGDNPPRKGFAPRWHPLLLKLMPEVRLFVLIGAYAQAYYLGDRRQRNLTETVRAYANYLPGFFPLVHPSPLNFRWQGKNPWFEQEVLPALKTSVRAALAD
ncbi:MAG: uracil-DNA glycosylase family protein [Clostridiales bacterium]|jgi:uracil-DNA glycosylase|nr:uracil-DNA glycosylase family protein [Clostridiales bacterium]